jgi:transcription-repair coupling factor (superfamily II helicase)
MTITQAVRDFVIKDIINFDIRSASTFEGRIDLLEEDIKYWKQKGDRVIILSGSKVRGEMLQRNFLDSGIETVFIPNLDRVVEKGEIIITNGSIQKGFEYQQLGFVVVSDKELFGSEKKKRTTKKKKKGSKIESFTDLKIGDYVVHDNYGIGVYRGIENMVVDNINKDYLKISYAEGGSLYVPTNQMDVIQKYIGAESKTPKLNKLGSMEWNKAKAKVKGAVKDLAKDLVKLYSARQAAKGFMYSSDTLWQREFEDMFPFEETEDQLQAIEEVKADMESGRVMDRLICGDVGYGKTEVAIRAAFKAVQDGKQVAYLVPTTILAQQHYNTFTQRMKDFPIKIGLLSRFRTAKQQKETISGLSFGNVDILIGTHRILSKDITFKDLGLVIVDEEQRFGVTHKEKLKKLKENVDVITLTATPIPRTLHMSLTGIRDMSVLEEPPEERQPIQTYVMRYDTEFIRDAIIREVGRGGQVFYLHNRVLNIEEVAGKIQKLVPEAVVAFAHGQMSERELETIMLDYINGEIDVLVCTTIIETGLDISNANTIIIQDADRMGLAQLYQLRGRVGRSNRIAYAYLMYQKDKVLQEVAEKRLQAIREFTEFGSGFKIAMRDLEIRGAGNLLGAQQHGHMETVGYDMYCKILDMTVKEMSGIEVKEEFETSIELNVNAYIPAKYIQNEEQKLEIYKKISVIITEQDYFEVQEEIEDRYGNIPKTVQNLLDIALLKAQAHAMDITSIAQKGINVIITYKPDANADYAKIADAIKHYKNRLHFTVAQAPFLTLKLENTSQNEIVRNIKLLLQELKGLK